MGKSGSADLEAARERFERVWPELLPRLLGAFSRHGLGEQAQDFAQQVALRLLMRSDQIWNDEQMRAYAFTAARWIMADYWRSFRSIDVSTEDGMPEVASQAATPSEAFEARRTALETIAQLTPREREVVDHVAQGDSVPEIARAMGVAAPTVRSLLRHARHRILGVLADFDDGEKDTK
jgi:RNA polymerase sigma factor (sigma-70 family)